jgi:hypothetical protein
MARVRSRPSVQAKSQPAPGLLSSWELTKDDLEDDGVIDLPDSAWDERSWSGDLIDIEVLTS